MKARCSCAGAAQTQKLSAQMLCGNARWDRPHHGCGLEGEEAAEVTEVPGSSTADP